MLGAACVIATALCGATENQIIDNVDIWEINHAMRLNGNEHYVQHIWWRWETHTVGGKEVSDFFVAAWTFRDDVSEVIPLPFRDRWEGSFRDQSGTWRTIRARQYMETWSIVDFVLVDNQRLPFYERSGLSNWKTLEPIPTFKKRFLR